MKKILIVCMLTVLLVVTACSSATNNAAKDTNAVQSKTNSAQNSQSKSNEPETTPKSGSKEASKPAKKEYLIKATETTDSITAFCMTTSILRHEKFPQIRNELGLKFEDVALQISQTPIAVSSGDLYVGECSGVSTVTNAWNKGAKNISIVAVGANAPVYQLVAQSSIKELKDLKGKNIGTPGMQSASTEAVEMILLRGADMRQPKDYSLVQTGSGSARVAALQAGKVDAIPTFAPNTYELADKGFTILADERDFVPQYVSGVHIINEEWAAKNRDAVVQFLKGIIKVGQWLENPANKDEVIKWIGANYKSGGKPIGPDYAKKLYDDLIVKKRLSFNGYAPEESVRANLDILKIRGFIKDEEIPPLGEIFDFSYLNQALKELGLPEVKEFSKKK